MAPTADYRSVEPSTPEVIECGVDWMTCTSKDQYRRKGMQELAVTVLDHEHQQGNDIKPWSFMGFEGLHGGGVGFGDGDGISLLRLSGPAAFKFWRQGFEFASNVSRFDAQVTVRFTEDPADVVLLHHEQAVAHVADRKRKPAVDLRLSNVKPPTLYLNQRTSTRFGRVYDKGRESKLDHYIDCGRYETQFNGKAGLYAARFVANYGDVGSACEALVTGFFGERGLALPWQRIEPRSLTDPRSRSNASRRLAWLRKQVAPCVQDLIMRNRGPEVFEALGLDAETLERISGPRGPRKV